MMLVTILVFITPLGRFYDWMDGWGHMLSATSRLKPAILVPNSQSRKRESQTFLGASYLAQMLGRSVYLRKPGAHLPLVVKFDVLSTTRCENSVPKWCRTMSPPDDIQE